MRIHLFTSIKANLSRSNSRRMVAAAALVASSLGLLSSMAYGDEVQRVERLSKGVADGLGVTEILSADSAGNIIVRVREDLYAQRVSDLTEIAQVSSVEQLVGPLLVVTVVTNPAQKKWKCVPVGGDMECWPTT